MSTRVDLVTLSLFIAVAEETSLAKAAAREHLAASAISKRLADLELNMNVRLFERKPTGMFLTAAGTALLHHARLIMHNVLELESEMVDFSGGVRGTIRVQANATAMASYLADDLASFLTLFPQVRIDIEESTSPETLRAIAENAADIGIYGDVVVPTELSSFVYRQDKLALLVPNGHPLENRSGVNFEEIVAFEFIGPPRGSSIDTALLRAASDVGVSLKIAIRSSGFDAISRLVDAGLGVAVMPESVASLYVKSMAVKVLPVNEKWAHRKLMICVRDHTALTPPAAAFLSHLTRPLTAQ
ncbi:MAG: LysR family transcriptional regulator [Hyphomicrobiaceae bacterium]|nr:LysR family transcriptional regulator [Hyphomicrobiaceae bacterium]